MNIGRTLRQRLAIVVGETQDHINSTSKSHSSNVGLKFHNPYLATGSLQNPLYIVDDVSSLQGVALILVLKLYADKST